MAAGGRAVGWQGRRWHGRGWQGCGVAGLWGGMAAAPSPSPESCTEPSLGPRTVTDKDGNEHEEDYDELEVRSVDVLFEFQRPDPP